MRITYRSKPIDTYWHDRWATIPADQPIGNIEAYPLKYAMMTIVSKEGRILEAGCGAGRVLRFYENEGYNIIGIDYVADVINKLKMAAPELNVEVGDIRTLPHADGSFRYVLAFGLYHNLETGLEQAVGETYRVLEPGGRVCASFRADNLQTRATDWLKQSREKIDEEHKPQRFFHKINLTCLECCDLLKRAGFQIEHQCPAENMPIFYQFASFRARRHRRFDESLGRMEGYRLNFPAEMIQRSLMRLFPHQFCNIFVLIARKPYLRPPSSI